MTIPQEWEDAPWEAAAILVEVTATLALRAALDHPAWFVVVATGYLGSFAALSLALRRGIEKHRRAFHMTYASIPLSSQTLPRGHPEHGQRVCRQGTLQGGG